MEAERNDNFDTNRLDEVDLKAVSDILSVEKNK